MKRGAANIEDQFRSALALLDGLGVIDKGAEKTLKDAIDTQMSGFLTSLLMTESGIVAGKDSASKECRSRNSAIIPTEFRESRCVSRTLACLHDKLRPPDRLLAQGEFDTFLLAAESERAELLEKITGTEIYAAISIRVHEGMEARRRTVEQLEQRRSDIGLLDDDARQRLLDEQSQLAEAVAQKAAERDRHNGRLDHFKRVVSARSDLAQAEAQATAARLAREAAADDYGALAEFDLVEPLRPLSVDLDNARRTATEAGLRLADLQVAREDTRTLDEAAATQLSEAVTADETAEDIFKRFGPLWSEAEKLDAELATAQAEFNDATEKSQQAETALRNQVDALTALDKTLGQTAEAHRIAAVQLKGQPGRVILADRLGDATALLEKQVILKRDGATVASGAAEAGKTEARLEGEIADLSKKLAADRDRKDGLTRDIGERRSHLAAIDEPALLERETILQRVLEALREATTACDRHIRASADLARGETELTAAAQEVSGPAARSPAPNPNNSAIERPARK